jgi:DNA modification methylase
VGKNGPSFFKTNEASGVENAATRKYFTKDHLWYFPPPEAFAQIAQYANTFGDERGKPYFSVNGSEPISKEEWAKYRAKFSCPIGVTNVWDEPPVNGKERIKDGTKAIHLNQKPTKLFELIISISSDPGDLVWEPFGGLCTAAIAADNLKRSCISTEIDDAIYKAALNRMTHQFQKVRLL